MSQPPWSDEKKVTNCAKCGTPFGVFTRKHHCRACGKVFCHMCSTNSIQLPNLAKFYGNELVRVCDTCFYKEKHEAIVRAKKGKESLPKTPDPQPQIQQETPKRMDSPSIIPPISNSPVPTVVRQPSVGVTPSAPPANIVNNQPQPKAVQKGQSFTSLPTSVRKDLQTKDVVQSIFDQGDMFAPSPIKPKTQTSNVSQLYNIDFQQKNNGANAGNDIFGNINTTPKPLQSNSNPHIDTNNVPPIPNRSSKILSPINPTPALIQAPISTPIVHAPTPTPTRTSPSVVSTPSPQSNNSSPSNLTPQHHSPIESNTTTPSAQSPLSNLTPINQIYDLPTNIVKTPQIIFSPSVLSLPDPCVSVFIPPRDGGVPETPKTRIMQEKLFIRWVNYYVQQRGIVLENLTTEFSDGVIFIHLLKCYTRVLITEETKAYCTPFPASSDDKYMNFYSGLCHLAYLQKPMPPTNIQQLVSGDVGAILNLLWSLLFRIEIEQKHLQGNDGIVAILTWVKLISEGFPNVNIFDFKKSFEDGLVFNAIVSKHNPRLIDFYSLNPTNKAQNVGIALGAMFQMWGVPMLLDVDDVVQDPDDVCIIIYLSQCYDFIR